MSASAELARLAGLAGILPSYIDATGERRQVGAASHCAFLSAMGIAARTPDEISASIRRIEEAPWRRPVGPVLVSEFARGSRLQIEIALAPDRALHPIPWQFEAEDGALREGRLTFGSLPLLASRLIDGRLVERRAFTMPFAVRPGYHVLHLFAGLRDCERVSLPIIVVPRFCFGGAKRDGLAGRYWGLVLQLYGLKSRRNWGIGDFSDLLETVRIGARHGADAIGLNPMHSLFPEWPDHASPYSPSHREFLGIWYIDPEAVAELSTCPEAQRVIADAGQRTRLEVLRSQPLVDYAGVAAVKRPVLELLYETFRRRHLEPGTGMRASAFRDFQQRRGASLERLGRFQALAEHFAPAGWRDWPAPYRDPDSAEVAAFAAQHRDRVEFFQYLQWQADEQLAAAATAARDAGMAIGLYHDLALAPDGNGAEAWSNQGLLAKGVSLGAPPDDWNLKGQNWGLPPYNPVALREAAYRPFIEMLRANMAHGGALRIDHVMGLERLFWIPDGAGPPDGGYVRYPVDEMFGILALESRRRRCLIIGEDLGTLPEGFHERMRRKAVLSYRLLYFAQKRRGGFREPASYPVSAAVAANTHDLATLAGFWQGRDLQVRAELDLFPSAAAKAMAIGRRERERRQLVSALKRQGLLPPNFAAEDNGELPLELAIAVFRYLARSPSRLVLVDLADILGEIEQVNVPGTIGEQPNWRRKASVEIESLVDHPRLIQIAAAVLDERRKGKRRSPGAEQVP